MDESTQKSRRVVAPSHGAALGALLSNENTALTRLHVARTVLQGRSDVGVPVTVPGKPEALTLQDSELIEAHRDHASGRRVTADAKRQLEYLSTWRAAVWRAEMRNGMRLTSMIDAQRIFARDGGSDEDRQAAALLAQHVYERFGVRVEEAPSGLVWSALRVWCCERTRALGILPEHLRVMKAPKGGYPLPSDTRMAPRGQSENLRW